MMHNDSQDAKRHEEFKSLCNNLNSKNLESVETMRSDFDSLYFKLNEQMSSMAKDGALVLSIRVVFALMLFRDLAQRIPTGVRTTLTTPTPTPSSRQTPASDNASAYSNARKHTQ